MHPEKPSGRTGEPPPRAPAPARIVPAGFWAGPRIGTNVGRSPTLTRVQRAAEDRNLLRAGVALVSRWRKAALRHSVSYPTARQRHRFAVMALMPVKQSTGGAAAKSAAAKTEVRDYGQRSHQGIGRAGQRLGEEAVGKAAGDAKRGRGPE